MPPFVWKYAPTLVAILLALYIAYRTGRHSRSAEIRDWQDIARDAQGNVKRAMLLDMERIERHAEMDDDDAG